MAGTDRQGESVCGGETWIRRESTIRKVKEQGEDLKVGIRQGKEVGRAGRGRGGEKVGRLKYSLVHLSITESSGIHKS